MPIKRWLITITGAPAGADDIHIAFVGAFAKRPNPKGLLPVLHKMTWDGTNEIDGSWTPACIAGEVWQGTVLKAVKPVIRNAWWTQNGARVKKASASEIDIAADGEVSEISSAIDLLPTPLHNAHLWRTVGFASLGLAAIALAFSVVLSDRERPKV